MYWHYNNPPILARAKEILDSRTPPPRAEGCELCMWREQVEGALHE